MAEQIINIVEIKNLKQLVAKNPSASMPLYNPDTDRVERILVADLVGGATVKVPWVIGQNYMTDEIAEFNNKIWKSLQDNNIGHQPYEDLTWWTEVSASTANGTALQPWAAGIFNIVNSSVTVENVGYLLNNTVTLPFESTDFPTELAANKWLPLGSAIVVATNSDMDTGTSDTTFVSPLKFVYGLVSRTFSQLQTTAKTIVGAINELLVKLNLKQSVNVGICESCPILSSDVIRDWSTRTLTINTINGGTALSTSNPIRFFTNILGIRSKWEKDTPQSVQWSDTKGLKYIYFDTDGVLKSSDTVWTIGDVALVWRLYWNPSEVGARRIVREAIETHPNTISAADHRWKHRYGAVWMSGFNLVCNILPSGAPLASGLNTCLSFTGGSCMDDNLLYTVVNNTTPADFNQDLGITTAASITTTNSAVMDITYNAPDGTLTIIDGTRFPFHAIAGVPQIITAGGIITPVTNGYFFNYYVYSFQDPRFGKAINLRSGLAYATKAEADAETWETIKAASPTLQDGEVKQLYKTTWEYRTSYDAAINKAALRGSVDLRSNAALSATIGGGSGASIASNVSVTPPSGYVSTNQQDLDNEFAARIDLREYIFFDDITVKAKISRPYNFTVSAKTESGGTGTITTSANAAYTLGTTVTANDYVQVAASAINTRVFLTLTRV